MSLSQVSVRRPVLMTVMAIGWLRRTALTMCGMCATTAL